MSHNCRAVHLYGKSAKDAKASEKLMSVSQSHKFHEWGEQDLANRMLSMDDEERTTFDYLRECSPGPPIHDKDAWMDGWAWRWCHEYWSYLGWYEACQPQPWRRWVLWDDWTMPWEHVKVVSPFNHFIKMFQLIWSLENNVLTPEPAMIKSINWTWLLMARWKEWPMLIYIGICKG